jgi:hypothetical protein
MDHRDATNCGVQFWEAETQSSEEVPRESQPRAIWAECAIESAVVM